MLDGRRAEVIPVGMRGPAAQVQADGDIPSAFGADRPATAVIYLDRHRSKYKDSGYTGLKARTAAICEFGHDLEGGEKLVRTAACHPITGTSLPTMCCAGRNTSWTPHIRRKLELMLGRWGPALPAQVF